MNGVVGIPWMAVLVLGGFLGVLGWVLLVRLLEHLAEVRSAREGEEDEALAAAVLASLERGEPARLPGLLEESGTPFAHMLGRAAGPLGLSSRPVGEARHLQGGLPFPARVLKTMEFLAVAVAFIALVSLIIRMAMGLQSPSNPQLEATGMSLAVLVVFVPLIGSLHHALKRIEAMHGKVTERRWELAIRIETALHPRRRDDPKIK